MKLDSLFAFLRDLGGELVTVIPRDADDRPLGVVVAVRDEAAQEFLEFLEQWETRTPKAPASVELEPYAIWDEDE